MIISSKNGDTSLPLNPLKPNTDENANAAVSFNEEDPRWHLEEIVMPQSMRQTINDIIVFCNNRKKLIEQWELGRFLKGGNSVGINLYGAPGTGKSITAEGIADAVHKKIIKVDYSEIQDSKLGGTEKKLTALFQQAEAHDSIIFFDEADGLLGKRVSDGPNAQTHNEIKSHLLTLIDRTDVIVIYSTNLFKNYDRAFFRRILYHLRFDLPQTEQLIALWKFHLGENIPKASDFSYEEIALASEGLAGGDIKNLTLKLCIRLAANHLQAISCEDVKKEIETYKTSLKDIQSPQTTRVKVDAADIPEEVKQQLL